MIGFDFFITAIYGDPENIKDKEPTDNYYEPFRLPIKYLDEKCIHKLSSTLETDLELATSNNKSMYEYIFSPKNEFSKNMILDWKQNFTSNIGFLEDSQNVLKDIVKIDKKDIDVEKILEIWKEVKENEVFLEYYSYVEWSSLKYLNESREFLQTLSVLNMTSPVLSFFIPFLFLFFPFIILKIQGIPISFSNYIAKLKEIAKHHMIGKTLLNLDTISWEKLVYIIITFIFYMLQMYQNTVLCMKFYKNINKINEYLCDMRTYMNDSIYHMEQFILINRYKKHYSEFCSITEKYKDNLKEFAEELSIIKPFSPNIMKVTEIGYLLKCFYRLHDNVVYEEALKYSFGFNGYLDNLFGVFENLENKNINVSIFDINSDCKIEKEYYPPLVNQNPIKNDCDLKENIIITGPNGSGKTTMLKTTTINIIFTQQFGVGFYKKCILNPYTHIFSYLNIPDTSNYDSLFQAEARRCKIILDDIHNYPEKDGYRHFYIFDEVFSGTSPKQAERLIISYLSYICKFKNVNFCITSHHVKACKRLKNVKKIKNYKMIVNEKENSILEYTYKMKPGISKVEGSISVLKQLDYPEEVIYSDIIESI